MKSPAGSAARSIVSAAGLGLAIGGYSWLLESPALADLAATRGLRSLGTTLNGGDSCSSGSCLVGGGRSRGENLFHRLDRFDTRTGINDVLIQNSPAHRAVVIGVIGRDRTQITVPVSLQNRAGLVMMSPAGISVSGNGNFLNVSQLALTNQTGLKVGTNWFDALTTTAQELEPPAFASPILFERGSLRTSPSTLGAIGLSAPGDISINGPGLSLVVERSLLLDAGLASLNIDGASLKAGDSTSAAGSTSLALYGNTLVVGGSRLEAAGAGLVNLQADATLNLANSQVKGLKIGLRGSSVGLNATTVEAPRGLIQIEANNRITVAGSTLDVTPKSAEDVLGAGLLDYKLTLGGGSITSTTPALISLNTSSGNGSQDGISISNSTFDASSLVNTIPTSGGIPDAKFLDAGNILISSSKNLSIAGTSLRADADRDAAGQISLVSLDPAGRLSLNGTTISASAPNGSGDILLFGEGPVAIGGNSRLEANTTGLGFRKDITLPGGEFNPPGEIRIISRSIEGISIKDSTLLSRYELTKVSTRAPSLADLFDPNDNVLVSYTTFLDGNPNLAGLPLGGLVKLTSAGTVDLRNSTLDAGSATGVGGRVEIHSYGGNGVNLLDTKLLAAVSGPLPASIQNFFGVPPESVEGLQDGRIDVFSSTGIKLDGTGLTPNGRTLLEASNTNVSVRYDSFDNTLLLPVFVPLRGEINLIAGGQNNADLSLRNTDLRASSPTTTGFPMPSKGGQILLALSDGTGSISKQNVVVDVSGEEAGNVLESPPQNNLYATTLTKSGQTVDATRSAALGSGTTPSESLKQVQDFQNKLTGVGTDLIIDQTDPNVINVIEINTSLATTEPASTQSRQSFDATTQTGLNEFENFLRSKGRDETLITNLVTPLTEKLVDKQLPTSLLTVPNDRAEDKDSRSQLQDLLRNKGLNDTLNTSQLALLTEKVSVKDASTKLIDRAGEMLSLQTNLGSPSPAGATTFATAQASGSTLSAALSSLAPLSGVQATTSLQQGEEESRERLAAFLGDGGTPPPVPTLAELQQLLRRAHGGNPGSKPQQAAILRLSYAENPQAGTAGEGSLDVVLVTPEGPPSGWRSTIQLAEFRDLLRRYYSDLAEQNVAMSASTPAETAPERRLFELLLRAPMKQLGQEGIGTLIISADPSLIDIPFNALHDGQRYLSQRFSLAVTPSLAFTNLAAGAASSPEGGGKRVNAGASLFRNGLTPLPMVEKELAVLSGLQQQGQVTTLLNQAFTPTSFSSGFAAATTRQVHIASHAEIAAGPQRVPTIYTGDTALSLRDLGQMRQRAGSGKLDLVTLSACRSALNGVDLELGFAGLAVQLGANTAIGTKWYVDDLATSSFFVLFYRELQQGMTKAEALRATQQAFASGQVRVEGTNVIGPDNAVLLAELPASYQHRYARGFSHPYYWAGVQLVGSPW